MRAVIDEIGHEIAALAVIGLEQRVRVAVEWQRRDAESFAKRH